MTELMLHRGARVVPREKIELIEAPDPTETWFPIRHSTVLSTVETSLQGAGFTISKSQFALSPDNNRFFGTLTLGSYVGEGINLAVGVRNSIDKTFPIGMCVGSRVFCCDNLAFSSEIIVTKKHTRFGEERFNEGISKAILSLPEHRESQALRIERMRNAEIDSDHANSLILQAYEQKVISHRLLPLVIEEYRHPQHQDFAARNRWSLLNAFTEVLKCRQNNPAAFAALTIRLQALLDVPAVTAS